MPNPTNNKLVDSKTIAALFDMTPRRVQQLTKDGVIAAVKISIHALREEGDVRRQADRPAASRERALPQSPGRCCGVCRRLAGRPDTDRRTTGKRPQESRRQSRPE